MSKEEISRNKEIMKLYGKGLGARRIAKLYNISPPRVTKIIQSSKKKYDVA